MLLGLVYIKYVPSVKHGVDMRYVKIDRIVLKEGHGRSIVFVPGFDTVCSC